MLHVFKGIDMNKNNNLKFKGAVCYLLEASSHRQIHDILIRPTRQAN